MGTIAGLELISPEQAFQNYGLALGLYGKSGVGKTTLAGTIARSPHAGKVFWMDCKGAPKVLAGQNLPIEIVTPPNFVKLDLVNTELLKNPEAYGTYVFDHVTHMQIMHLNSMSRASDREWKHYTRSQEWIIEKFLNPWIKVTETTHVNVIFIFQQETDQEEDTKRWIYRLNLTPHLAEDLPYYLDYMGYLTLVQEGSSERKLSFAPSLKYVTKTRRPLTGVGSDIPGVIYHPDLGVMLDVLKGDKPWPAKDFNTPKTHVTEQKVEETKPDGED